MANGKSKDKESKGSPKTPGIPETIRTTLGELVRHASHTLKRFQKLPNETKVTISR